MDNLIQISKINDFIFCPYSLFFHSVYESFDSRVYHRDPQAVGKIRHENIDEGRYSTAKKYLQGTTVYNEEMRIIGKIDIYDIERQSLIERKNKIKKVYDGFRYQLYAQYFCLIEMGMPVKQIFLHSLSDNKRINLSLPDENDKNKLIALLSQMRNFKVDVNILLRPNKNKCLQCIYSELCYYADIA